VDDRRVLGLARARRDDAGVADRARRRQASSVSVSVPRWFGFSSTVLAAPRRRASRTSAASETRKSSPTICTRVPAARVKRAKPRVVLGERVLDRDDRVGVEPAQQQLDHAVGSSSRDSRPSV
jgi:hypothetical protein